MGAAATEALEASNPANRRRVPSDDCLAGHATPGLARDSPEPGDRRPRFSLVVPAYNEENFIGDCLDSLLRQDFGDPYEIIVVDNNSADDTAAVAKSRGVTVVREDRQGVCWARQRGTELAAGEIIVSTDADTTYAADWLSKIDREFRSHGAPVAVAGPFRFVDAPWWARIWTSALFGYVHAVSRLTRRVPYIAAANVAFRAESWPGYNTWATQGGDELDLLHSLQGSGKVAFVPDNPVFTSSRRLSQGMIYGIFVAIIYYYVLGYSLNRLVRRPLVGMAPAFRSATPDLGKARRWRLVAGIGGCFIIVAGYMYVRG